MIYRDTEVIVMESGTASIIQIRGRLDYKIADTVLIKIEQVKNKGFKTIIFDLENTTFISSLGLGIIASARDSLMASGGKIKITGIKGMIEELFRITGLIKEIEVYGSLNEAIDCINGKSPLIPLLTKRGEQPFPLSSGERAG